MQMSEQKRRGYRPKSLTGRDNYGLTAVELVEYMITHKRPVPDQLDRAYCEQMAIEIAACRCKGCAP